MTRSIKKIGVRVLIAVVIGAGVPMLVALKVPLVKALPRMMSYSEGVWKSAWPAMDHRRFPDLNAAVDVAFDSDGIPHIVAKNDDDLYFAQGVLLAHFRLWEMDLTTRVGLGRLSEVLGERGLTYDEFFVRFGFREAVAKETDALLEDPTTAFVVQRFIAGVNSYIASLDYRDYPVEYKITGSRPEFWTPQRVAALLKVMTFRLDGRSNDLRLTQVLQRLGPEKTNLIYPEFLPPAIEQAFVDYHAKPRADQSFELPFVTSFKEFPPFLSPVEVNGSNAWAVAPERSKDGHSLLSNDTHLSLQLPAVWFEMQLIAPGTNIYGATFPGAPGLILGFNSQLSWGVTNGGTDVLDWYEIEFKDEHSPEYLKDGQWKSIEQKIESITVAGRKPIEVTVSKTDFGILLHREGAHGLVARWIGSDVSNELRALGGLAHAKSVVECLEALHDWKAPAQNFVCADADNISNYHTGRIPKRASGRGRVVEKATSQKDTWQGEIPFEELPHETNPPRGFVYSANERPVGPAYPYYLGWDYEEPFRAQRIFNRLSENQKVDGPDMVQMQGDVLNQHAAQAMPVLLARVNQTDLTETEKSLFEAMKQWDFYERARSIEPTVFDRWWTETESRVWKSLDFARVPLYPKKARTILFFKQLQDEPDKYRQFISDFRDANALVTEAFKSAVSRLEKERGKDRANWQWTDVQITELPHVTKFPGFGTKPIVADGGAYSIFANRGHHGPAWKMVVEMGPNLHAWTQIPGGITGNPLDPEYDKFVESWARGEMRDTKFWKDAHEAETASSYIWRWSNR